MNFRRAKKLDPTYLYIFSCAKGRYVGITGSPLKRMGEHGQIYGRIKFHIICKFYIREKAMEAEIEAIRRIGLGNLLNEDPGGHLNSEEHKKKISTSLMGHQVSIEARQKMRLAALGRPNPFEGRKHTEITKQKLSKINRGKKLSEETKEKISKATTGLKRTEETKERIRKANLGAKRPLWARQRMREARIAYLNKGVAA